MATLVFDIETSALTLDTFDDSSQEYLMRPAARLATEEEQEAKREELVRMMNLWPFTARVVCGDDQRRDAARTGDFHRRRF